MRTTTPLVLRNLSVTSSSYTSHQLQVTALETSFASQATNGNFLAAMTAASGAFSIGRALGTSLFSNLLGGAGLRSAAWALGFTSEVLTFRGANQILNPGSESWLNASGLASTATDFLFLKGAGVLCGQSAYGVRQFTQATAMVAGEYAGEAAGVRVHSGQALSARFVHALATGVAMDVGGHLTRMGSAGWLDSIQRNLQQQTTLREQATLANRANPAFAHRMATPSKEVVRGRVLSLELLTPHEQLPDIITLEYVRGLISSASTHEQVKVIVAFFRAHPEHMSRELLLDIVAKTKKHQPLIRAVYWLTRIYGDLLSPNDLPALISRGEKGEAAALVALDEISSSWPKLFSRKHLTAMVNANSRNRETVRVTTADLHADVSHLNSRTIQENLSRPIGALMALHGKIFSPKHVDGIIASITADRDVAAEILLNLVSWHPSLFKPRHVQLLMQKAKEHRIAAQALSKLLVRREDLFTRDQIDEISERIQARRRSL